MTLTLQELTDASANLPAPERAQLAEFLLQSLRSEEIGWAAAWEDELTHRLEDIRSGQVAGVPAVEVLDRLRGRYP